MKTFNVKQSLKTAALFASSILTIAMITACGKNGGGDAPPPSGPGVIVSSCTSCPANSALLASGVGRTIYGGQVESQMALEFYGDGTYMQSYSGQTTYSPMQYAGTVAAQGSLQWNIPSNLCGIPAGAYAISTVSPGYWRGQSFNNLMLTAVGPTSLQIMISGWITAAVPSLVGFDGRQYPFKVQGQMYIRGQSTGYYGAQTCPIYVE